MPRPMPRRMRQAGDLAREPQQRGIVGNIFSGVSTIAGGAANITGNTVNWVIDLPGKAISAGGKLLTGNGSTPAAAPGNALRSRKCNDGRKRSRRPEVRRLPRHRRRLRCR